jgi:predicted nucleic acid-binding protein
LIIYCDSSALLKRVLEEPKSAPLENFLAECIAEDHGLVSSAVTWIEMNRAIRARRAYLDPRLWIDFERTALSGIRELPLDPPTMSLARRVGSPALRSLDAIHLATAIQADVDVMLTYDSRLGEVANEMGIETSSPE